MTDESRLLERITVTPEMSLAPPVPVAEIAAGAAPAGGDELSSRVTARRNDVALLHAPLRARLTNGYAAPPAGRRVVLASYFSVDTSMR
ncbi:MAG: hypothetical protein HYZ29_29685 [Myxococcales bacterium]|nr:hypothetical protein [Myxococcales bacterium]